VFKPSLQRCGSLLPHDRLGPAREVAQIGAVLGRDFAYPLLRDVAETDEPALQASLERLAEADLLFVEGAPPEANYRFKHALIQDAAYDSLLKSRRQALHRRAAELLRDEPERAAAEPEVIAHHFTEAGLDDLAIEWWGKAGDHALRRSAFQEAIAHLGKAIAMADKAGATSQRAPGGSAAPSQPLTQLHAAYGNALIAARGYGAPETTEAFARARESASGDKDAPERLAADYGLWASSYMRGELPSMRAHAGAFLSDVEARPDSPEAGVAHRAAGATCWFAGEYREARDRFERALALFQPGRDDDLAFRFGQDPGVAAMAYLAIASWPLGEVDHAISLIDSMQTRMANLTHVGALAFGGAHAAMFELMRGDRPRARARVSELARVVREHDLPLIRAFGEFLTGWATADGGAPADGLVAMRRGAESLRQQNALVFDGLIKIALAEAEAQAGDPDRAIAILDEALATADRLGYRAFEAELHRVRGELLLERDPANATPAEDAFLTAIAVAKQQATRSFEVRAALALSKLYQSTGRPADAHAVLAPALEGFAPTPEMPEIAEARALLAALAETDEVKAAIARRERRLDLQTSYGQALQFGKGFAAEETRAAFARARELAGQKEDSAARFAAYYGQCIGSFLRGEFPLAQETAETFLREAEADGRATEAGTARRLLAMVLFFQGDLKAARSFFERASADFVPERDGGDARRIDGQASATAILASLVWHLGEVERARLLIQQAIRRARELGHAATIAQVLCWNAYLEIRRDDVAAARLAADALIKLAEEYGLNLYATWGQMCAYWATGRLVDPEAGTSGLRQALQAYMAQGKDDAPLFHGMLAELEAATRGPDSALTLIDQGLTIAEETGGRFMDPYLHRLRGDILLKRDPADPGPAEGAYRTAIAIAKQQGARSYELLASLSLAKLHQATGRPNDAYAVLAPALEGFSPTPEMPEIAEAQALMERLA
jgi:predicted ATPase